MENEIYNTRVVPFVRYIKKNKNGRVYTVVVDNFTSEERKKISCDPKMLRENNEHVYIEDMPPTFNGGTGIKGFLCYVFDELNEEEQAKYFDRSIVIPTTIKSVEEVNSNSSKRVFGKKKTRERK